MSAALEIDFAQCPRSDRCNSPICLIDSKWESRVLCSGETTCFYLLESQKEGAEGRFRDAGLEHLYQLAAEVGPKMAKRHSRIKAKMLSAALSGSRMDRCFGGASHE